MRGIKDGIERETRKDFEVGCIFFYVMLDVNVNGVWIGCDGEVGEDRKFEEECNRAGTKVCQSSLEEIF